MEAGESRGCAEGCAPGSACGRPACLLGSVGKPPPAPGDRAAAACDCRPTAGPTAGGNGATLTLDLHPATSDYLSLAVPHIGIPNFVEGLGEFRVGQRKNGAAGGLG